jgi:hypothetical protein
MNVIKPPLFITVIRKTQTVKKYYFAPEFYNVKFLVLLHIVISFSYCVFSLYVYFTAFQLVVASV